MAGRELFTGRVQFILQAYFAPPASWSKTKREAAIGSACLTKPDADNLAKVWADALNGIVYVDDVQIYWMLVEKHYAHDDCVVVTVTAT